MMAALCGMLLVLWCLAGLLVAEVVQLNLVRQETPIVKGEAYKGRFVKAEADEAANKLAYAVACKIGTPGQDVLLGLDTGSSDTWVPAEGAGPLGAVSFDPGRSSTFGLLGRDEFDITYVDGSTSRGDFMAETLEIGGVAVRGLTVGLAHATPMDHGMLGIGYAANEVNRGHLSFAAGTYDNLPVRLHQIGAARTRAFSLWLNDMDMDGAGGGGGGSVLFGAIDTAKYRGGLARLDVQRSGSGEYSAFVVMLSSLVASGNRTFLDPAADRPLKVLLDSGTSFTCLPEALIRRVWAELSVQQAGPHAGATLPCDLGADDADGGAAVSFGFGGPGGPVIDVPMRQLLTRIGLPDKATPRYGAGPFAGREACWFGLDKCGDKGVNGGGGDEDTVYVLGDAFLRSAYVVYDMVNNEVALAPAVLNASSSSSSSESRVVEFAGRGAPIPLSTRAPNQPLVAGGGGADDAGPAGFTSDAEATFVWGAVLLCLALGVVDLLIHGNLGRVFGRVESVVWEEVAAE